MNAPTAAVNRNGAYPAVLLAACAVLLFAAAGELYSTLPQRIGLHALSSAAPAQLSAFADESGAEVRVEAFRGKVAIVNLWAPWCGPCMQEMPALDRLAGKLSSQDFVVLPVTRDEPGDTAASRAFARLGLAHLKFYRDLSGRLSAEIGARGLPTTLILGPDGVPASYREGAADWDSDEMVAYLSGLKDRSPRAK